VKNEEKKMDTKVVCGPQGVWTHHRPMLQHERKKMDCEEEDVRKKIFIQRQSGDCPIFF